MTIDWAATTKEDMQTIRRIVERADGLYREHMGQPLDKMSCLMDIEAAHIVCPLKLDALEKADDANFAHDVFGIQRHLNRVTGELEDCFLPRFARLER